MKVLVIGGLGSIGSRYVAILKHLGHEPVIYDTQVATPPLDRIAFDKAIIATPTDTHFHWCLRMITLNKPFLCEKPLCKDTRSCELLKESGHPLGFVVNNYSYLCGTKQPKIKYDYFRTGNDGLHLDCCQLIYLDPTVEIKTDSPVWKLTIDGYQISYLSLEYSYIHMISDFVVGAYQNLWTLEDGVKMTDAAVRRANEDRHFHSGKI